MLSRRLLSVLLVVPVLAVAACGGSGGEGPDAVEPVASATPTPSPDTTSDPAAVPRPATTAEAAQLGVTVLGENAATTPEEQAVVEAYMRYWTAVSETYDTLEPAAGLDAASGKPLATVLDYLGKLKARGHRSVGWTRENVQKVVVNGESAAIRDCAENFSFEVDDANLPLDDIVPFYATTAQLTKKDGRWVLTGLESEAMQTSCLG